jgi:hypothetical protein
MIFELIVTCFSILLCAFPIWIVLRLRYLFVSTHLIFVVALVFGLHIANLVVGEMDRQFSPVSYVSTHFAWVAYTWLFCVGCIIGKAYLADRRLLNSMLEISDGWLTAAFCVWLGFKLYLVSMYGVKAFGTYRQIAGVEEIMFRFAWWETGLEHLIGLFAVGACVAYVAKAVLIPGYWKKAQVLLPLLAFSVPYIVALESPIGSRRLLFILALIGILLGQSYSLKRLRLRQLAGLACVAAIVLGASAYYQSVRQNFVRPSIAEKLVSENTIEIIQGAGLALLPNLDRSEALIAEPASQLREGAFELVYDIVTLLENGHPGTKGEIAAVSMDTIVPRAITGEGKIVVNADEVISDRMGITPKGEFLVLDLTTSVLAICLADFGTLGLVLAPMIVLFGFAVMFATLRVQPMSSGPWLLLWCATLLHMAAGAEADLVSILAYIRNVFIIIPTAIFVWWCYRLGTTVLRAATPKPQPT